MGTVLHHAPDPVVVDGVLAVPVHVRALSAGVVLDAHAGSAHVDARLTYRVGPTPGCALFDLRQPIDQAWLDGRSIAIDELRPHGVGEGPYATVRVVRRSQPAGSTHTLRLRYRLAPPDADLGGAYPPVLAVRGRNRVRWSFGMGDLFDGRHLEMWFPTNLPFDQFPFVLDVVLAGATTPHTVITNGTATPRGTHAWRITYPAWFSSVAPMLELRPTDELEHAARQAVLRPSGRTVPVDVWKVRGGPEDLGRESARIVRLLQAGESTFGTFAGDRFACLFHGADGGMEYAGATTTSSGALAHEVLHSWFARGVLPASDADGWWDEGFTTYLTTGAAPVPLDFDRPPVELCSRRPFQRHTPIAAYGEGSRLFSGLAALVGPSSLVRAMAALFRARSRTCLSTAELEQHLVLETGDVRVVDAFHRFVYGFPDARRPSLIRFAGLSVRDGPDGRPWISARVSNDAGAGPGDHYLLLFSLARRGAGPGSDGAVPVAAVAGFELRPGQTRTVRTPLRPLPAHLREAGLDVVGVVHRRLAHPSGVHRQRDRRAVDLQGEDAQEPGPPSGAAGSSVRTRRQSL